MKATNQTSPYLGTISRSRGKMMGYPDDNTLEEIEHGMSLIYDKEEQ